MEHGNAHDEHRRDRQYADDDIAEHVTDKVLPDFERRGVVAAQNTLFFEFREGTGGAKNAEAHQRETHEACEDVVKVSHALLGGRFRHNGERFVGRDELLV